MEQIKIVSTDTAKLLKELGFDVTCPKCYGTAVLHNGEYISFDEECELKSEGRGDEIEYVDGGMLYTIWFNNNDKEELNVYSAPDIETVRKWFRDKHNLHITAMPYVTMEGCLWLSETYSFSDSIYSKLPITTMVHKTYEDAIEAEINKLILFLKTKKDTD